MIARKTGGKSVFFLLSGGMSAIFLRIVKYGEVFMRWILGICCLFAGVFAGWFCLPQANPYALNYKHIAINLPISHSAMLQMPLYPLGEKYLAEDIAFMMQKSGYEVKLYALEDTYSNRDFKEGYEFYMRFFPELQLPSYHHYFDKDRIAVLFETIPYTLDEVKNADIVLTGSLKKNREYREQGINSHFIPQFTRTDKFYFAPKENLKTKVLFIGNRWPDTETRKSVAYALKNNIDVDVYGAGWNEILTGDKAKLYKGAQVLGDELKYYYSSADIVLNDTREDMAKAGFISNRIFDVTACGGFVISDYISEIAEIYGDSVPMYKNSAEFKALIDYYLAHPEERKEKAARAQKITLERFSAEAVIKQIISVLEDYQRNREAGNAEK